MSALLPSFTLPDWLPPFLVPFLSLSYPVDAPENPDSFPNSTYYRDGPKDICFMTTCIIVMAVLRDALRLGVFEPFASWKLNRDARLRRGKLSSEKPTNGNANGNANNHDANGLVLREQRKIQHSVLRFAEQGWSAVYYPTWWCFGFYVHSQFPTRVWDPTDLWVGYPHIPLAGTVKFYYLSQTAFYTHQMLILNAEARRKDHWQMMTHHVVTVFLMGASYLYNFTRVGCLIMMLMDLCDVFLPLAKMIKYMDISQTLCDFTFGCFLVSWLVTRHIIFLRVIWSAIFDVPRLLQFIWDPETGSYLAYGSHFVFVLCLVALQILQLIWFSVMCKVAWRVLTGKGAVDARSDDESEDDKDK